MHQRLQANDCPNFYTERPCPHDPTRYCMVWMAGTFLAPGTEVGGAPGTACGVCRLQGKDVLQWCGCGCGCEDMCVPVNHTQHTAVQGQAHVFKQGV
jgi:hypothetical protein